MSDQENASLLDRLYVATPCTADWDKMTGDERTRFCSLCTKKVFNISDMSRNDAEEFLQANVAIKKCVRFYRRKDGTILTDDCPVGLRKIRNAALFLARVAATILGACLWLPAALADSVKNGEPKSPSATTSVEKANQKPLTSMDLLVRMTGASGLIYGDEGYRPFPPAGRQGLPPFEALVTGNYPMEDEIIKAESALRLLEEGPHPSKQIETNILIANAIAVDLPANLTVWDVYERARQWEKEGNRTVATSWYKLALNYFEYYPKLSSEEPTLLSTLKYNYNALIQGTKTADELTPIISPTISSLLQSDAPVTEWTESGQKDLPQKPSNQRKKALLSGEAF